MLKRARVITAIAAGNAFLAAAAGVASAATHHHARRHGHRAAAARRHLRPRGVRGGWRLVFNAEFNGHRLSQSVWNTHNGWANQNNVTDSNSNLSVSHGNLIMTLASPTSGAEVGTNRFSLAVGEFAEARIRFSGSGSTIYNWPAWWISGPNWPSGGENDIAEGLGDLTINYHSPAGADNTGTVPGTWSGGYHTYGIYRGRMYNRVYWDGRLVRTYPVHDDGQPETLLLTMGAANHLVTGPAGAMYVDWVRAWAHA